jgi:hypothetical protein
MTDEATVASWRDANREYLLTRIAAVRATLMRLCRADQQESAAAADEGMTLAARADEQAQAMASPPALDRVIDIFSLSMFERDVLALCAGAALDPAFAGLCAAASGDPQATSPTFALAFAAFDEEHWSAITPSGALRKWRLVQVGRSETLLASPLRIDESVLHHLLGAPDLDECFAGLIAAVPVPAALPHSFRPAAEQIATLWTNRTSHPPILHLSSEPRGAERPVAAAACAAIGLQLHALAAADIPASPVEREHVMRLWEREAALTRSVLLLDYEDGPDPHAAAGARAFIERVDARLIVIGRAALDQIRQPVVRVAIERPPLDDQRAMWVSALGPVAERLNGDLDAVAAQFPLDVTSIHAAAEAVRGLDADAAGVGRALWNACRVQTRRALDGLAERIETHATWNDLVLPDEQREALTELTAQVRNRRHVYETWGFEAHSARGLGISAIFAGPSGCGKTLAAEIVAGSLHLDLYRIDLSQVVSKYIGETEKALRRLFDAAEASGAVLLFDEADALFGKRSEVRDSHDRYANVEVSYLLQRMDSYRGLAILTTNRRDAIDAAFLRRIRFIVSFPFPDATQRVRIWERVFPAGTPTDGLDAQKLARLNVAGGSIRNIAMNAAFLAASGNEPVRMLHLLRAARSECAKLEKPISHAEIGAWV